MDARSWVMLMQVLPDMRRSSASRTFSSLSTSSPVIGSSRIKMGALRTRQRAMARRWRWPPESVAPRSAITVS
jgi:hypothetical protein